MNLKIDLVESEESILVKVAGEIDVYTAPKLRETLFPLSEKTRVNIVIDLSAVEYMDSTGLGVFVGAFKNVRSNKGTFQLVGLSDRLKRLFEITGLADIMNIGQIEGEVK